MQRYADWPIRLNKYLTSIKDREFKIGEHDCCHFANGAVKAMTGVDMMGDIPEYSNWDEAKAILDEKALYRIMFRKFGKPVRAGHAQQGDIAYINRPGFDVPSLGIVLGKRTLVFGIKGYVQMRTVEIDRAFKVPF